MRILRTLAGAVLACGVLWTGWWVLAARGQEAALAAWLGERTAQGWQAEARIIEVSGFPQTFDRRIEGLALADPRAGWAWNIPQIDAASPAWDPTNIRLTLADSQTFAVPGERASVSSDGFGGVLSVVPGPALALRETGLQIDALSIAGQSGWEAGAKRVDIAVSRRDAGTGPENSYDIELDGHALRLPRDVVGRLDPTGQLGLEIGELNLSAQLVADRPLDRYVIESGEIGAETLVIRNADLTWDDIGFRVRGRLDADPEGYAEGDLEVEAREWKKMLTVLKRSGTLGAGLADTIEGAMGFVAMFSGSESITVTLGFSAGRMRLGPVPIGDAPRLVDRAAAAG